MRQAVIEFQRFGEQYQIVLRHPSDVPNAGRPYPWQPPQNAAFEDLASEEAGAAIRAGNELLESLQRTAVGSYVSSMLQTSTPCDLFFAAYGGAEVADDLPWEALHSGAALDPQHDFLALRLWPIGRIQPSEVQLPYDKYDYEFFTPLKVMAILSAPSQVNMVSAATECDALIATLALAQSRLRDSWGLRADSEALSLLLCLSEPDLIDSVTQKIEHQGLTWIRVIGISDKQQLLQLKSEFHPHFLHFFCHGTGGPDPKLFIGSRRDWEIEADGSIALMPSQLADPQDLLWLVTLNCCLGADNSGGAYSFAKMLVRKGVPAAIGMREPVNGAHAEAFCRHFYTDVFTQLEQLEMNGQPRGLDWAAALKPAREAMNPSCDLRRPTQDCKHWTLPVLYRRTAPFRVLRLPERTLDRVKLAAERSALRQKRGVLAAMNDGGQLTEVIAKFDADIAALEASLIDA